MIWFAKTEAVIRLSLSVENVLLGYVVVVGMTGLVVALINYFQAEKPMCSSVAAAIMRTNAIGGMLLGILVGINLVESIQGTFGDWVLVVGFTIASTAVLIWAPKMLETKPQM